MKRGTKFKLHVRDREFEVAWCGKSKALGWARKAQMMQLEDQRELYDLRKQYPADVSPELHEVDEDGNPLAVPPGAPERQYELCTAVLHPALGEQATDELFDEDPLLCFELALEVLNAHRLDAKVPLS